MLSEAVQDYLKAIWKLGRNEPATTSAIAEKIGVSAASATAMLKKLASLGLVEHERYRGAALTQSGERVALEVIRHHRLLELYLISRSGSAGTRCTPRPSASSTISRRSSRARSTRRSAIRRTTRTAIRSRAPRSCWRSEEPALLTDIADGDRQ